MICIFAHKRHLSAKMTEQLTKKKFYIALTEGCGLRIVAAKSWHSYRLFNHKKCISDLPINVKWEHAFKRESAL